MSESHNFAKVINIVLFIILMAIGILYILAAPVNPVTFASRILTGVILIVVAIVLFIVISLLIQRSKYKVEKTISKGTDKETKVSIPELVCKNCGSPIALSESLMKKNKVICEQCGEEIIIPKDNIDW